MKTPRERTNEIARQLYMGDIPDAWTMLAGHVIERHLRVAIVEELMDVLQKIECASMHELASIATREHVYSEDIAEIVKKQIEKFKA